MITPSRPPTAADVERIATIQDAAARNHQITQCYHELARSLASRTTGNANWCVFATWASRQAGQTIRGEDLRDAIEHALDESPVLGDVAHAVAERARALGATRDAGEIRRVVLEIVDPTAIVARTSDAVARGNLKVFVEIGRVFARFIAERAGDGQLDAGASATFCASLRDGEPPDGQRFLKQAFSRYYRALFEPDAKVRTELLFFANVEVGLHEQTRLQPEILAALDAPVLDPDEIRSRVLTALFPRQAGWFARARTWLRGVFGGPTPLDAALRDLVECVRAELRRVITEHLMTLTVGRTTRLHLGSDLRGGFPASLAHIADVELAALLARIDPTPDSSRASGASDWGDLPERMHFIADLFRAYHESRELLEAPFDAE